MKQVRKLPAPPSPKPRYCDLEPGDCFTLPLGNRPSSWFMKTDRTIAHCNAVELSNGCMVNVDHNATVERVEVDAVER